MTRVAIVAAMRWEARGLGRLAGASAISGPGAAPAAATARRLVAAGANALVSWGIAAGLDPALGPGALLVPPRVLATDGRCFPLDAAWHTEMVGRASGLDPQVGPLVETPSVLASPAEKSALRRRSGAIASDMESAAVVRVASEAGLSALVVRVVLDPATAAVPVPWARTVDEAGGLDPRAVAAALLRPGLWGSGAALAWQRRRAARTLRAAARVLADVCMPAAPIER